MFFEQIGNLGMCRYFFVKKRKGLSVWNTAKFLCSFHTMIEFIFNTCLPSKKDKPITDVLIIYLIQPLDSYTYDKVSQLKVVVESWKVGRLVRML